MEYIHTDKAPKPIGPYSQAVTTNGFLFISGQLGLIPESMQLASDVTEQTKAALANIDEILLKAGLSRKNIVKMTIFLNNMDDFQQVNIIYADYFQGQAPARSTVGGLSLPMNAKVELEVTAEYETMTGKGKNEPGK